MPRPFSRDYPLRATQKAVYTTYPLHAPATGGGYGHIWQSPEGMVAGPKQRRLAVILHADVVGSTSLVQRDEALAHERIRTAFAKAVEVIETFNGKAHEIRGDALVAEFARASDAVGAALTFQQQNCAHNEGLEDLLTPELRMGIGLGEVVVADGTVTGAGVVLAQRVEQLAAPNGVCVTGAVREAAPEHLPVSYTDLGPHELKGFTEPVQILGATAAGDFSAPNAVEATDRRGRSKLVKVLFICALFVTGVAGWWWYGVYERGSTGAADSQQGVSSEMQTIAVLPFSSKGGGDDYAYFSDGITEDIITDLSGLANLTVISRNATFAFRDGELPAREVGRQLAVRYVLEGSVRRVGDRVRVTANLIDAEKNHQIWAERYDRKLTDVFAVQDDVKRQIVQALSVRLSAAENQALEKPITDDFAAYDAFLKGRRFFSAQSVDGFERAIEAYREAIALDPAFARAYGALATTLTRLAQTGATESPIELRERARVLADRAVKIDPGSAQTHWARAFVHLQMSEFEPALESARRSVEIAPNFADGHLLLALINNNMLRAEDALRHTERAMALNPAYSWDYPYNQGRALYVLKDYARAVEVLTDAVERNEENFVPRLWLTASYVRLGQLDDAEWEAEQIRVLVPQLRVSTLRAASLDANLRADLLRAGLPE